MDSWKFGLLPRDFNLREFLVKSNGQSIAGALGIGNAQVERDAECKGISGDFALWGCAEGEFQSVCTGRVELADSNVRPHIYFCRGLGTAARATIIHSPLIRLITIK